MMNVSNIWVYYVFCFIFGVCIAGRYTVGYVFFVEMIPKPHRIKYALAIDFSEGFIITLIVLYLRFISKDWIYLQYLCIANTAIGSITCYYYLRETPRFLIKVGREEEALLELRRIAHVNGSLTRFE